MPETQPRSFDTALRLPALDGIQQGVLSSTYRGIPCLKSPFDLVLYSELIDRQGTASVIEIGTKFGGSALWFADAMSIRGKENPRVVSVDIEALTGFQDPRIEFLVGDAANLGATLTDALLQLLPRPWLVVEDSSHLYPDATAVLHFFDAHLTPGDCIVVEDGILDCLLERDLRPLRRRSEQGRP